MTAGEITTERLKMYADLFINRRDRYLGLALEGHWICRKQPLTSNYLAAALRGEVALGHYSVDQQGMSRWVCLDLDDDTQSAKLIDVVDRLLDPRQALLEMSRRGHHLWLFVEPAPWERARAWGRHLADQVGLKGIEVFPKGAGLNGVRAPLTPHPKGGITYPLIDIETGEMVNDPWPLLATRRCARVPEIALRVNQGQSSMPSGRTSHWELVELIEQFTTLRQYGPERAIGRCPFHDDQHPSLSVLGGFWRCWAGCGEGGLNAFRKRAQGLITGRPVPDNRRSAAG